VQHDDEWNGLTRMKSTWDIQLVGAAPMCAHMNALLEPRAARYRCTSALCWMEELPCRPVDLVEKSAKLFGRPWDGRSGLRAAGNKD
jgi:hypothetical protein